MKFDLNSKTAIVAYLISSHATTAKSFVPSRPPMQSHVSKSSPQSIIHKTIGSLKRPYTCSERSNDTHNTAAAVILPNRASKIRNTILSLRAGAGSVSALTLVTSSLNTFFKKNPYAAAFLICKSDLRQNTKNNE